MFVIRYGFTPIFPSGFLVLPQGQPYLLTRLVAVVEPVPDPVVVEAGTNCNATGTFPDPESCGHYIQCVLGRDGELQGVQFSCPAGLQFHPGAGPSNGAVDTEGKPLLNTGTGREGRVALTNLQLYKFRLLRLAHGLLPRPGGDRLLLPHRGRQDEVSREPGETEPTRPAHLPGIVITVNHRIFFEYLEQLYAGGG